MLTCFSVWCVLYTCLPGDFISNETSELTFAAGPRSCAERRMWILDFHFFLVLLSSRHKLQAGTLNCVSIYSVVAHSSGVWSPRQTADESLLRAGGDTESSKQGEISVSDWPTGGGGGCVWYPHLRVWHTEWLFIVSAGPSGQAARLKAERDIMQDDEQVLQPAVLLWNVNISKRQRGHEAALRSRAHRHNFFSLHIFIICQKAEAPFESVRLTTRH